jgi:hypothetical protein
MRALQVLGTVVLGFLLLLSLVILGVAVTLQSTALSPNFVIRQVDKIDLPTAVREVAEQQAGGQLPAEEKPILDAAVRVVADKQPWLKEQAGIAIHAGYDFLLGKADSLTITLPLRDLKDDFRESLWQGFTEDPAAWLPFVQDELNDYFDRNFAALAQNIRPYLPPDVTALPDPALQSYLHDYLLQVEEEVMRNIPPETYDTLLAIARPYFDNLYDQAVADIPDVETFSATDIPADVMTNLLTARDYIRDFRIGFYTLIAFTVFIAGCIVLIWRRLRPACLSLGIVLIIAGALELSGVLIARGVTLPLASSDIPPSLQTWITGIYRDVLQVPLIFDACALGAGLILLVTSFLYRPSAD